jgi:hypothetical protein
MVIRVRVRVKGRKKLVFNSFYCYCFVGVSDLKQGNARERGGERGGEGTKIR